MFFLETHHQFLHVITVGLCVLVTTFSVCIGQGIIGYYSFTDSDVQPTAQNEITKNSLLGLVLLETSAIIGLLIALFMLFFTPETTTVINPLKHFAEIGIACAISITGLVTGYASAHVVKNASTAIARQPFFAQKIQTLMIISIAFMQTGILSAFIIALFIKNKAPFISSIHEGITCISAGLCIGLGSIGPLIGLSLFSQALCRSIGHNRDAYPSLFSFAIITQAFIEALLIFALLIALFIINTTGVYETISTQTIQIMASAACIGLGTLATGIASGYVSSITCQNIAQKPSFASLFSRTNMLAQIFIETSALYAALIAFFLVKL